MRHSSIFVIFPNSTPEMKLLVSDVQRHKFYVKFSFHLPGNDITESLYWRAHTLYDLIYVNIIAKSSHWSSHHRSIHRHTLKGHPVPHPVFNMIFFLITECTTMIIRRCVSNVLCYAIKALIFISVPLVASIHVTSSRPVKKNSW
jgi:hypothetical protein